MKLQKIDLKTHGFMHEDNWYYLCVLKDEIFGSKLKYAKLDGINYEPCVDTNKILVSIYKLDELYVVTL